MHRIASRPVPNLPLKPPVEPQLARSRAGLPVGEQWSYEPKYDGFRALAAKQGGRAELLLRSGADATERFPEISSAVAGLPAQQLLLDGELVILDEACGICGERG